LAIAFIIALTAALIGPYFIDWNQFRPQFEAEAARVIGAPVRVGGELDARLLPTPTLRLRSVVVGGANDLGKVRADKLDVEFSLGSLMRGEWRADELTIGGMAVDLGLNSEGRVELPASTGKFNLGSLAIDRLNMTGRVALHDAASRKTLELDEISFSGDVRSLAGAVRGDGSFTLAGARYPFRVSSGQSVDGNGTRIHLNIDPGSRALSADLDGVITFEARAPRFDGAVVIAVPPGLKTRGDVPITPWRISARVKADAAAAQLEQLEASYGAEERALKFAGLGDISFGASPLLHATLSARQLDADRLLAKDNKDNGATEPPRSLPALRAMLADIPPTPIPAHIEFSAEQIMVGARPVQNLAADLRSDSKSWTVERLDFRAPGSTLVSLTGNNAPLEASNFSGAVSLESSDPDALAAWLQDRNEPVYRNRNPLRLRGNLSVTDSRIAIEAMKAEIDGGVVEGRLALANRSSGGGSRLDAELQGERLDLDAATAFARSLAGPQAEWPEEALVSLDIGRATSSGQELRPFQAKLGYGPKSVFVEQLRIGEANGVMLDGAGDFDRANASGKMALNSSAASISQITALIAPLAPALAARIDSIGVGPGPARIKLALAVEKDSRRSDRASARAVLDLDTPKLKGVARVSASPDIAALRGIDFDALRRSEFSLESKLSSDQSRTVLAFLGLDGAIQPIPGPAQFEASVSGVWRAPLRLKAKLSGAGLDAEAQGSAEPWAEEPKANMNLSVRGVSLAPLLDLKPNDTLAQNLNLSSRVSLNGSKLTFDDLDSAIAGSRLRGRVAITLDREKNVEGEVGLDTIELAPVFALAMGAAGRDAGEPLGSGLLKGWRGHVAFQALRGALPGGGELRPFSGTIKSDGQTLTFDAIKGAIGGGQVTGVIDAKPSANGIALNANLQLSGADGKALRYHGLTMPAGRTSLQMTLMSQGRSASALTSALSGSGIVKLESVDIPGLNPRAFETAIRASDSGQATDDSKLRQIVEPVLSAGVLSIKSAQIPFTIGDARLRVGATTFEADGARAVISGGYDIPADQADFRVTLASTTVGNASSRPEIQLFAAGSPDALARTLDVTSLSSWLAVRAIDRETRRLDLIERGVPSAAIPPPIPLPSAASPDAASPPDQPTSDVTLPGRDPRRPQMKPRISAPRAPAAPSGLNPPVYSQQVSPLPPPIEVRPAPSVLARPPKPKPPLVLTPPPAISPQRPAF
jgi:large subunit ribosomal protein L24